jgi:hypothetical protein
VTETLIFGLQNSGKPFPSSSQVLLKPSLHLANTFPFLICHSKSAGVVADGADVAVHGADLDVQVVDLVGHVANLGGHVANLTTKDLIHVVDLVAENLIHAVDIEAERSSSIKDSGFNSGGELLKDSFHVNALKTMSALSGHVLNSGAEIVEDSGHVDALSGSAGDSMLELVVLASMFILVFDKVSDKTVNVGVVLILLDVGITLDEDASDIDESGVVGIGGRSVDIAAKLAESEEVVEVGNDDVGVVQGGAGSRDLTEAASLDELVAHALDLTGVVVEAADHDGAAGIGGLHVGGRHVGRGRMKVGDGKSGEDQVSDKFGDVDRRDDELPSWKTYSF